MIDDLTYDNETVGDIYNEPLAYSTESVSSVIASQIMNEIKNRPIYKDIVTILPEDKVYLYYFRWVVSEIRPYVLNRIIIDRNLESRGSKLLCFPEKTIFKRILSENNISVPEIENNAISERILSVYKRLRKIFADSVLREFWWSPFQYKKLVSKQSKIAVHLGEGVDLKRRSDFTWFTYSGIDPKRVLVLIDTDNIYYKRSGSLLNRKSSFVPDFVLRDIEKLGMRWVFIGRRLVAPRAKLIQRISFGHKHGWLVNTKERVGFEIDKWIFQKAKILIKEIQMWKVFYKTFNVGLYFLAGEESPSYISRGIAFDVLGDVGGFIVGKQRSELGDSPKALTGYHTKDIFFSWNERAKEFLKPQYNKVSTQVIAGHPNDMNFYEKDEHLELIRKRIMGNGAEFIVALFDTGHGLGKSFLTPDMESFYKAFLTWIMEDTSVGLVIKSKKPYILKTLPKINHLLADAQATGRCKKLTNEVGRLPSDASRIADIAIGAGVSSAVTEAVIAGCRGCHYHNAFPKRHIYYKWGHGRIVFDDLEQLMNALKKYKSNPELVPELGDWSAYMTLLDPFRDGKSGRRMGDYFRWCLQGFDARLPRDDVMKQANEKYTSKWGTDYIINHQLVKEGMSKRVK